MKTTFFISDHHFGHANILRFKGVDNKTLIRPEFSSLEHMNEEMIRRHNMVVTPNDKVYFLGDVAMYAKPYHSIMPRLNGEKVLILGNHDNLRMDEYYKYFKNIYSSRRLGHVPELKELRAVACHYPLHINADFPNHIICVHGHIHEKEIITNGRPDPNYFNVSVERINYTPIEASELTKKIKERL